MSIIILFMASILSVLPVHAVLAQEVEDKAGGGGGGGQQQR